MKPILALLLIGSSGLLAACETNRRDGVGEATPVCALHPIRVSDETRAHLRAPLAGPDGLPDGYESFLRDLAAHNAMMAALCPER
ncbi:MAG: hypothetical protein AAGH43_03835 [Pseudomonadota bacterium]